MFMNCTILSEIDFDLHQGHIWPQRPNKDFYLHNLQIIQDIFFTSMSNAFHKLCQILEKISVTSEEDIFTKFLLLNLEKIQIHSY